MTREVTLQIWCEMGRCEETATMTFDPGEDTGRSTAAGFHILVIGTDGTEEDYCTKHWVNDGRDPNSEVEYE
jgi:thymidine kinase